MPPIKFKLKNNKHYDCGGHPGEVTLKSFVFFLN